MRERECIQMNFKKHVKSVGEQEPPASDPTRKSARPLGWRPNIPPSQSEISGLLDSLPLDQYRSLVAYIAEVQRGSASKDELLTLRDATGRFRGVALNRKDKGYKLFAKTDDELAAAAMNLNGTSSTALTVAALDRLARERKINVSIALASTGEFEGAWMFLDELEKSGICTTSYPLERSSSSARFIAASDLLRLRWGEQPLARASMPALSAAECKQITETTSVLDITNTSLNSIPDLFIALHNAGYEWNFICLSRRVPGSLRCAVASVALVYGGSYEHMGEYVGAIWRNENEHNSLPPFRFVPVSIQTQQETSNSAFKALRVTPEQIITSVIVPRAADAQALGDIPWIAVELGVQQ
jgi:hypothetical protein